MNVFISHAFADKEVAEKIAAELKAEGFSVTHPLEEFAPGENIALKVGKALEHAGALVALLSPESVRSNWVQSEIGYALTSPQFQGRLVPVMLKKTGGIPWILHNLQVLNAPSDPSLLGKKIADRLRQAAKQSGSSTRRVTMTRPAFARA